MAYPKNFVIAQNINMRILPASSIFSLVEQHQTHWM